MFRPLIHQLLAATTLIAMCVPVNGQATATKALSDQILPQETYLYLSFPDVADLKEFVSTSSFGQLWDDPEFDDFKDQVLDAFGEKIEEGFIQFEETLGMTAEEFIGIPEGEITLAFSGAPGNKMGAIVFIDFGDKESLVLDLLDKSIAALSNVPALTQKDTTFAGTDLTIFTINHNGPPPTPLAVEFGWFIKDQRLVISNRSELLESALTNWDGERDDSFRSNEAYSYILSRCEADDQSALNTMFFDPMGLLTQLVQTGSLGPQLTIGASVAMGVLPQIGLNQMKAIGSVSKPGSGDFEAVTRSVFFSEQPPAALMQVLQLDSMETTPPAWVKDNVTGYGAMKWKIGDAYAAIENVTDMFAGAGYLHGKLDKLADEEIGLHLKLDVIDQLTGEVRFASAPGEAGGFGGDQVVALGVKDEGAADAVVSKIAEEMGLEVREFRGMTIYEMSLPGGEGQALGLAVSEGKLLIGMGGSMLEQVLRNDGDLEALADSEDYQRVAQHFPRTAVAVQFSRPAEQYRSFYELLRSGAAAEQFPGTQDLFERIDFTTLPPFEVLEQYIHPSGVYTENDENGYFMEGFQLKD